MHNELTDGGHSFVLAGIKIALDGITEASFILRDHPEELSHSLEAIKWFEELKESITTS